MKVKLMLDSIFEIRFTNHDPRSTVFCGGTPAPASANIQAFIVRGFQNPEIRFPVISIHESRFTIDRLFEAAGPPRTLPVPFSNPEPRTTNPGFSDPRTTAFPIYAFPFHVCRLPFAVCRLPA